MNSSGRAGNVSRCDLCEGRDRCASCSALIASGKRVVIVGERVNDPAGAGTPAFLSDVDAEALLRRGAFLRGRGRAVLLRAGLRWHASLNLLPPAPRGWWNSGEARRVADALWRNLCRDFDVIVFVGVRVRNAFRFRYVPTPGRWVAPWGEEFRDVVAVPHPSGKNLYWNSGERAANLVLTTFREALEPAPPKANEPINEGETPMSQNTQTTDAIAPGADAAQTPAQTAAQKAAARPKKTEEELAAEPNWMKVRRQFAALPEQRQLQLRLERAAERLKGYLENTADYSCEVATADGGKAEAFAQARAAMDRAEKALEDATNWIRAIPNDWKPAPRAAGAAAGQGTAAGAEKKVTVGSAAKLKGATAKQEPDIAKNLVRVVKLSEDGKTASVIGTDGDGEQVRLKVSVRDLTPVAETAQASA